MTKKNFGKQCKSVNKQCGNEIFGKNKRKNGMENGKKKL